MRSTSILAAAILTLLPIAYAGAQVHQPAQNAAATRYTPEQLRDAGAKIVQQAVAEHGRATNPTWQHDVGTVLSRLMRAADVRDSIQFVIVNDTTLNATAVPGGFMIVNAGLLTYLRQFAAAEFPGNPAQASPQYEGFLASTLGHELAHQTLGHTSGVGKLVGRTTDSTDQPQREVEQKMADPAMLQDQRRSRQQELDADGLGSIYALRAGWTVQHAIDLFRILDSVEKSRGETVALEALTWLRGHPRASERAGRLEMVRGTLMIDQARYDDAVTLIRNGVELDTAVTLLDTVLAHFPHLQPAEHARAAALHQQFIRKMSARDLAVRGAVATYEANIMGAVRGEMPPATKAALDRARAAYRGVLAEGILPYSLCNLAVLDAYAGDLQSARARADSAVRLDTADISIRVNRGVVLFLSGRPADALAEFRAAERLYGGSHPIIGFDIGRALLASGDSAAGRQKLIEYAEFDESGPWHDLALSLVQRAGGDVAANPKSRPTGTSGLLLPVPLGATAAIVRQTLGAPDETGMQEGSIVWHYKARGVLLVLDAKAVVVMVGLEKPETGSIDGVRVGDATDKAFATWGASPDIVEDVLYFYRGEFVVIVQEVKGKITRIAFARNQ